MQLDKNSEVFAYRLYSRRVIVPISITHNATPASKLTASDLPDAITIRTQGLTAAADAIDSGGSFTSPTDNNAGAVVFGVLGASLGSVSKLLALAFTEPVGLTSTSIARKGASSTGVTASGNIAVEISGTGNLATTDASGYLTLEFILGK